MRSGGALYPLPGIFQSEIIKNEYPTFYARVCAYVQQHTSRFGCVQHQNKCVSRLSIEKPRKRAFFESSQG